MKKQPLELVFPFTSPEFIETWNNWEAYRQDIKKPYRSMLSAQMALKKLSKYKEHEAIEMIEQSIENGWQGIFELKQNYNAGQPTGNSQKPISPLHRAADAVLEEYARANGSRYNK